MQLSKRSERSTQRANESKVFRRIAKVQWKYSRADSLLESQRQLLKPLQRARPRNVLSQRRGISGYIWSADPDSGFQAAVILKEEEGARGTNSQVDFEIIFDKAERRSQETCFLQSNCKKSYPIAAIRKPKDELQLSELQELFFKEWNLPSNHQSKLQTLQQHKICLEGWKRDVDSSVTIRNKMQSVNNINHSPQQVPPASNVL